MKPNIIEGPLMAMVDGQFVRVDINCIPLGRQDELLRKLASDLPFNITNAFKLDGGGFAHIQTRAGQVIVWTELFKLNLRTVWTAARDGSKYPVFLPAPRTSPPEHEASYVWDPKLAGMRLFFTSTLQPTLGKYVWVASYLVAKAPRRKESFRPPLPNIFGDGRLCLGNDYIHIGTCLADVFLHNLAHLEASKWNSDAMEGLNGDACKALYSFDKDGKQMAPPKDYAWTSLPCSYSINNDNYGFLPIAA